MNQGLNDFFFHLLWAKNIKDDPFSSAYIPDTVIYQYALPRYWYFTSKSGLIMKKSNQNLNESSIFEAFKKKISESGIIAMLMYIEEDQHIVDYLDIIKFERFMRQRKKNNKMILQKFIDPQGERNTCYTVIWTNNLTVFEKKENNQKLFVRKDLKPDQTLHKKKEKSGKTLKNSQKNISHSVEHYERAVTFDGKEYHVTTTPIFGTLLPGRLQKAADFIAAQLSSATFNKSQVTSMTVQFKLDPKNRLWVLCATSLQFLNESISGSPLLCFSPGKDTNFKNLTVDKRKPARFLKDCKCSNCLQMHESSKVVKKTYREIIKMYNKGLILNILPKLNEDEEDFEKLKEKPEFLAKELFICFECFTEFVENNKKEMVLRLPELRKVTSQVKLVEKRVKKVHGAINLNSPLYKTVSSKLGDIFSTNTSKYFEYDTDQGLPSLRY